MTYGEQTDNGNLIWDGAEKMTKKTFGDEGWSPSDKITGLLKLLLRDTFTNIRLILTFYS